jgi:hypothetical protein
MVFGRVSGEISIISRSLYIHFFHSLINGITTYPFHHPIRIPTPMIYFAQNNKHSHYHATHPVPWGGVFFRYTHFHTSIMKGDRSIGTQPNTQSHPHRARKSTSLSAWYRDTFFLRFFFRSSVPERASRSVSSLLRF